MRSKSRGGGLKEGRQEPEV